ncbi:DUF4177 domain-containing protein [Shimia sp.]|uniref:DUF4177 domain-containing protein n=1 Tax=Shimia sp. TaxID=1954381 RepID=UPI0032995566
MTRYEYKVVPAPAKGRKGKKVKGPEGRFAFAVETVMNDMAAEGWEFQRTETLPSEERSGLTSSTTTFRSVMVFRRAHKDDASAFAPRLLDTPAVVAELPAPVEPVKPVRPVRPQVVVAEVKPEPAAPVVTDEADATTASEETDSEAKPKTVPEPSVFVAPKAPTKVAAADDEADVPPAMDVEKPATAPLVLTHADRKEVQDEEEPEIGATVSDISIALRARAKNVKQT